MPESSNDPSNNRAGWFIWLFPLIAVVLCGWLLFNYLHERGPEIQISFDEGSSLQAEKTEIRFRGVDIGKVNKVVISEDNKGVIAYATLKREATHFAVAGSRFWIVSPKVSFSGVSGLETLIEGTYIAVQPGKSEAEKKLEFEGQNSSESSVSLDDMILYNIESSRADSLNAGDSITFRGLKIGSVYKVDLTKTAQGIRIQIAIEKKYARLIRTNTAFWKKTAVNAKLGLFNSSLKIESMESLLRGGIECSTPEPAGPIAKYGSLYTLWAGAPKDSEKWNPKLEF